MSETINIQPITNPSAVLAYAERVQTSHPWDHVGGQLYALSALAATLDDLIERLNPDARAEAFVEEFRKAHRNVTNEFLGMFGEPDTPEVK